MINKAPKKKTAALTMALEPRDRAMIDRAAKILELPPSVWARAELLKQAAKIVAESKQAK